MTWFYNLRIANKLVLSFIILLLLTTTLGVFSISQLGRVNQASTDISSIWLPAMRTALQMKTALARIRVAELQHILSDNEQDFSRYEKSIETQLQQFKKMDDTYARLITESEERTIYPEFKKNFAAYLAENLKILKLSRGRLDDEARHMIRGDSTKLYAAMTQQLDRLAEINQLGSDRADQMAQGTYVSSRIWIIGILLSSVALGLLLAFWVAAIVARPLNKAVEVAQRVADGDLTGDISVQSNDETGKLMGALQAMNGSLLGIVAQVRSGTDTIAAASTQIASGNLDLSSRTEEQASSLEETASAMEELTATVKQNADNARQANQLAVSASEVAMRGGGVVEQVVGTMGAINEASKKIVDIISVIDGIAFQTNILALNAAVEAARAGEQGRGFAVVASEVRNLAQRSASAAKEIKNLIDDSVSKVDSGSQLVAQAGQTMAEVVASVRRVTDIVGEITAASQEQSSGIEQVNLAITQMDEVTQQNAALVEEAAAAAQSLQDQAANLSQVVSVFKIDQHQLQKIAAAKAPRRVIDVGVRTGAIGTARQLANAKLVKPAPKLMQAKNSQGEGDWEQF